MSQGSDWEIRIVDGVPDGLEPARVNVVIDVIRAFTTTQIALSGGAKEIVLVESLDEARSWLGRPDVVVAGEREARKIDGFDLGNSPAEHARADLRGRTVVLTTTNGVPATHASLGAEHVFVVGFAGARSLARFLHARIEPGPIHLVASKPGAEEDHACAEYLAALLRHEEVEPAAITARIEESRAAAKFLDPKRGGYDPADIAICRREAEPGFVMPVVDREGRLVVRAEGTG